MKISDKYTESCFSRREVRSIRYENRYLVTVLSSVINEKKAAVPRKKIAWGELLKIADFHHVINPLYYGTLGLEKTISSAEQEELYRKYHKEILLEESYKSALEAILWQMNRHGIPAALLRGVESCSMYPKSELGYTFSLEFLVSPKDMGKVYSIMSSMDYEERANRTNHGKLYIRVPGVRVVFYDEIQLGNEILCKYLTHAVQPYFNVNRKAGNRTWKIPEKFLYQFGKWVDAYMMGELKMRDIMDYYYYTRNPLIVTERKSIEEILEKAGLTEFAKQLDILRSLWFDSAGEADTGTAFQLEEYIFSKGMEDRRLDSKIISYEKIHVDFYRRDREEEWGKKRREWMFPTREYMVEFFPILQRIPQLLWICWIIRGIRVFRKSVGAFIKEKKQSILVRMTELKIKIISKINKKAKEGIPEDEEHEDR